MCLAQSVHATLDGLDAEGQLGLLLQVTALAKAAGELEKELRGRIPPPEGKTEFDDGSSINRKAAASGVPTDILKQVALRIDPRLNRFFPPLVSAKTIDECIPLMLKDDDREVTVAAGALHDLWTATVAEAKAAAAKAPPSLVVAVSDLAVSSAVDDLLAELLPGERLTGEEEPVLAGEPQRRLDFDD